MMGGREEGEEKEVDMSLEMLTGTQEENEERQWIEGGSRDERETVHLAAVDSIVTAIVLWVAMHPCPHHFHH